MLCSLTEAKSSWGSQEPVTQPRETEVPGQKLNGKTDEDSLTNQAISAEQKRPGTKVKRKQTQRRTVVKKATRRPTSARPSTRAPVTTESSAEKMLADLSTNSTKSLGLTVSTAPDARDEFHSETKSPVASDNLENSAKELTMERPAETSALIATPAESSDTVSTSPAKSLGLTVSTAPDPSPGADPDALLAENSSSRVGRVGAGSPPVEATPDWITHNVHNIISDKLPEPTEPDSEEESSSKSKKRRPQTAVQRRQAHYKRRPSSAVFARRSTLGGVRKRMVDYGPKNLQDRRTRNQRISPQKGQSYARVRSFAVESLKSQERTTKHKRRQERKKRIEGNLHALRTVQVRAMRTWRACTSW